MVVKNKQDIVPTCMLTLRNYVYKTVTPVTYAIYK